MQTCCPTASGFSDFHSKESYRKRTGDEMIEKKESENNEEQAGGQEESLFDLSSFELRSYTRLLSNHSLKQTILLLKSLLKTFISSRLSITTEYLDADRTQAQMHVSGLLNDRPLTFVIQLITHHTQCIVAFHKLMGDGLVYYNLFKKISLPFDL